MTAHGSRLTAHGFRLDGRLALVTGSTSGIGAALARGLGEAGAHVLVNGCRLDRVAQMIEALCADGIEADACPFDTRDEQAGDDAIGAVERSIGPIDVLVNNAGMRRWSGGRTGCRPTASAPATSSRR